MSSRLGEILIKENLITSDQLRQALEHQKAGGGRLGTCLMKLGFISDDEITGVLSRQYGVPSINLKYYEVDATVIKLIPQDTAIRYQIVPLSRVGSTLTIAMTDPTNVFAMDDIKFMTGFNVEPVVASETAIAEAISKFYGEAQSEEELTKVMKDLTAEENADLELAAEEQEMNLAELERAAEEAPIIKLVNLILTDAVKRGASDIHIEPYEKEVRVRFRIDGILQAVMTPPMKLRDAIISRIKIMAKLDISEKAAAARRPHHDQVPQGRQDQGSRLPRFHDPGPLRRKDRDALARQRESETGHDQARLRARVLGQIRTRDPSSLWNGPGDRAHRLRQNQHLYSSIARLNTPETNIMTAEDPVEFQLAGINQVQMKDQIGLNFAAALRAFLRQDPNIILVGEIRDFETAEIAVKGRAHRTPGAFHPAHE